ncbi:calcium/calmodulin dependent protein kinase 2 [Rhizopus microsporus ATCC 52813]|uniref:Calcium/calmodulin dependent protein kinase 2 n=1 Tax=Rhizopus microsporus ATCC 52813 TaxID=1340429 RepID=A0A2G4SUI4_RHIZD|nr:calcium/calmodulin dependent protein kinase 2 [Rhizopus microsporus ATCC 52813]PHZ12421.1 calcium/calmodulin dependent protein kinase 2 [Rhizopus microsporus ATCC 52813]
MPHHQHNPFVKKVLALFKKTHEGEKSQYPTELTKKYKIGEKQLGVGSFAVVKECVNLSTGEHCAVKIILKKVIAGKQHMLDSELDILKKVRHSHVVSLHDIYESDDAVYIITDLCTGGELFQRIVERGTYTESTAADLVRQLLEGLAYLHSMDIVHRDIKPENLLFKTPDEDAELLITDFGLSKLLKNHDQVLTTACGTPGYVAPEVLLGTGHGKPVDLWSVGVIMYTLLSGYTPFYGEDQNELFSAIMSGRYEFDDEYWSEISAEAKNLIDRLLTFDPKDRITAEEALEHPWIMNKEEYGFNLAPTVRKGFNNRRTLQSLITVVAAINKMRIHHPLADLEVDEDEDEADREK